MWTTHDVQEFLPTNTSGERKQLDEIVLSTLHALFLPGEFTFREMLLDIFHSFSIIYDQERQKLWFRA